MVEEYYECPCCHKLFMKRKDGRMIEVGYPKRNPDLERAPLPKKKEKKKE